MARDVQGKTAETPRESTQAENSPNTFIILIVSPNANLSLADDAVVVDLVPFYSLLRLAGLPTTLHPACASLVSTAPASMTASSPITTPGRMIAPPDPNVLTDEDRLTELKTRSTFGGVSRMVSRVDLHGGTDLRPSPYVTGMTSRNVRLFKVGSG